MGGVTGPVAPCAGGGKLGHEALPHTSPRSAEPEVAVKMAAGAMAATGVTAAAAVGLGNRRWRWWFDGAEWAPPVRGVGRERSLRRG